MSVLTKLKFWKKEEKEPAKVEIVKNDLEMGFELGKINQQVEKAILLLRNHDAGVHKHLEAQDGKFDIMEDSERAILEKLETLRTSTELPKKEKKLVEEIMEEIEMTDRLKEALSIVKRLKTITPKALSEEMKIKNNTACEYLAKLTKFGLTRRVRRGTYEHNQDESVTPEETLKPSNSADLSQPDQESKGL